MAIRFDRLADLSPVERFIDLAATAGEVPDQLAWMMLTGAWPENSFDASIDELRNTIPGVGGGPRAGATYWAGRRNTNPFERAQFNDATGEQVRGGGSRAGYWDHRAEEYRGGGPDERHPLIRALRQSAIEPGRVSGTRIPRIPDITHDQFGIPITSYRMTPSAREYFEPGILDAIQRMKIANDPRTPYMLRQPKPNLDRWINKYRDQVERNTEKSLGLFHRVERKRRMKGLQGAKQEHVERLGDHAAFYRPRKGDPTLNARTPSGDRPRERPRKPPPVAQRRRSGI